MGNTLLLLGRFSNDNATLNENNKRPFLNLPFCNWLIVFKTSIHLFHFYRIIFAKSEHFIEDSRSKNLCGT